MGAGFRMFGLISVHTTLATTTYDDMNSGKYNRSDEISHRNKYLF